MKSRLKFDKIALGRLIDRCYDHIHSAPQKKDALRDIAATATDEFGEYISPVLLENPNEISVNIIELLDQIVFVMDENKNGKNNIHSYIIDDLYMRISIYIEAMKDIDLYCQGLINRTICMEDTVIIRFFRMREYIPAMLREFNEQPNLQKHIIKCLLSFDSDDLLNFYYQIAQGTYDMEVKALSLVGIKAMNTEFSNWQRLKTYDDELTSLISYVEGFDIHNLEKNTLPYELNSLIFAISFIELKQDTISYRRVRNWMLNIFKTFLRINISDSIYNNIYTSISNIFIGMDDDVLESFINNDDDLIDFIYFMDLFPRAIFNRITMKLDHLGHAFVNSVNNLISSERVILDEVNSNIQTYLIWNAEYGL